MKSLAVFFAIVLLVVGGVGAQDMMTPSVTVSNQAVVDGAVVIDEIVSSGPAFMVIHADNGGAPGAVIGFREVNHGTSVNVSIPIDVSAATPTLYAMLHNDDNTIGVYEFGTVEGADAPVFVDDVPVSPAFSVEVVGAFDQLVSEDGTINIASVVTAQNGFIVIHAGTDGGPGPVLGFAPVTAGVNSNVLVTLTGEITDELYPMLHVDTGEAGVYEFGEVEGADGPVIVNNVAATARIYVASPSMRIPDQIVTDTVVATSVVSEGPGWLVIHADNGGAPGAVIGFAQVVAGTNVNVSVPVDAAGVTPVLFPMLHTDTGVAGTYEFGEVEGEDLPVRVGDAVLVFPINAASSITYNGALNGDVLSIESATIDTAGWLVIHADNGGAPGAVLGFAPLVKGLNTNIQVLLATEGRTNPVFPMLHTDTGVPGVYEFGEVEGEDLPVRVGENVVVGQLMYREAR